MTAWLGLIYRTEVVIWQLKRPAELRAKAEYIRKLAEEGDDRRLREALRLAADEFDDEAARAEALEADQAARNEDPKWASPD